MKNIYFSPQPFRGRFEPKRQQTRKHKINHEIRAPQVRLIDSEGEFLGIMSAKDAQKKANESELDLVEIAPNANPPVCKIIDYGKFSYEIQKKEKMQKRNQSQQQMKEIRFKWRTATHDFNFKTRHARDFIEEGNKVKASVMFRGREITHQEVGKELLEKFVAALEDIAKVDSAIRMEGRNMTVIMAPEKSKKNK